MACSAAFRTLLLTLASRVSADPSMASWVKSETGDTCVGFVPDCKDKESCTSVGIGPCKSAEEGASKYIKSTFQGMALVDEAAYLDCTSADCDAAKLLNPRTGYRDFGNGTEDLGYHYLMTGALFGNPDTFGAYMGIASYFNTGKKDIETSTNDFYVWSNAYPDPGHVTRGASDYGAPFGPVSVCIAEVKNDQCSGTRTITTGEYKFSVFGYTFDAGDDEFADNVQAGKNDIPDPLTHFGVRMKLEAVGFTPEGITFNGGEHKLDTLGTTQVTSFELLPGDGSVITYEFPQSYNFGDVDATANVQPLDGSGQVVIRVSRAGATAIFVDYLFKFDDFDVANRYFVYDPSISTLTPENSGRSPRLGRGVIAGVAVGGAVLLLVLVVTAYAITKKKLCCKPKKPAQVDNRP